MPEIPSLRQQRKYRKEECAKIPIYSNKYGFFNGAKEKITAMLTLASNDLNLDDFEQFVEQQTSVAEIPEAETLEAEKTFQVFRLKFAGDGTCISRKIKVNKF